MTTPNQPYPAWMAALGLGAFQLGGSGGGTGNEGSYGQSITESWVNDLVYGPLAHSNVEASSSNVTDVVSVMISMLASLPISALKYLQPFSPGATDADFADSSTAANFIANQFVPKTAVSTLNWLGRFLQDLEILFDVFHITYPAGAPSDAAGQTSWYAAWNDLLQLIGLTSGTTPTSTAPTIGTAITAAGTAGANGSSWSTRLTNDLLILLDVFHITYTSTQWTNAWTDLLALFGIVNSVTAPTNPTPTIGPAISSAQSTANTGVTNAGTAQTTANTGLSWGQRLTNDLTTLLDVFHVTYTVAQWNAAWADLLVLFGIVNSTSTPSNPAPTIGSAITSAQATANTGVTNAGTAQTTATTANTNAGTAQSWATRLTNDLTILLDVFHVTYTTTQWNNAWSDLLVLFGVVNATSTPSNPAPTIGSSITSAQSTANTGVTNAATAQSTANTGVTNASAAQGTANTAVTNASTAQATANTGNTNTGTFLQYSRILADVLHLTYQAGSPSDTPTTLGTNGLPTWYSAWNGLLVLEGLVKSTTAPTQTAPTTGTVLQATTATANTASTNASIAIANNQATNVAINTALSGVADTSSTAVQTNLGAIPASNIVGQQAAAVTWGATGVGNIAGPGSSTVTTSWSHTPAPTDLGVDVFINFTHGVGSVAAGTVTYGGAAMTKVNTVDGGSTSGSMFTMEHWRISITPTGSPATATISATAARVSGVTTNLTIVGNSVSYYAAKILSEAANSGSSATTDSQSKSSSTGKMLVGVFGMLVGSTSYATVNQTQRSKQTVGSNPILWIGDAAGAASVTFNVSTGTGTSVPWAGFIVELSN